LNFRVIVSALFAIGLLPQIVLGQGDSIYMVSETSVIATRDKVFNAGTYTWEADSNLLAQYQSKTLGELLGQQSGVFIRSFTPGTLATSIMRGTYGVHTNVVWNGFSLQSPMNQVIDLNLIPAFFVDEVEIAHGSQSALYGSGAVGGTIGISQQNNAKGGFHGSVLVGAGSFETYQQGVKLTYKTKGYTGKVRYFNQIAQNNYSYINKAKVGTPKEVLNNAYLWQNGQMVENYFTINKRVKASLHGWHMRAHRGVAPLMFQERSVAFQKDDFWRVMGDIKVTGKRTEGIVRIQYSDERIRYNDSNTLVPINSDNRAFSLVAEGELRYKWKPQHDVSFGINTSYFKSTAGDYGTPSPVQYRPAVFLSHRFHSRKSKVFTSFTVRQEGVTLRNTESLPLLTAQLPGEFTLLPIVPTLGANWNVFKGFWLNGKVSRVYRYPSFNDLYWNPGGNPNLKPEDGLSTEAHIAYKKKKGALRINTSFGGYYNDITNWILWQQGANGIWSPQNVLRVVARGIELNAETSYKLGKTTIKADVRYAYTISTNEKEKSAGDESYKKQLIYVPYNTLAGNISATHRNFYIRLNGQYTGAQFLTSDNKRFLPAFNTVNAFVGGVVRVKEMSFNINLQAQNLLNEEYQVVEWAPMPLRNYLLTIQFNF
jgi:iron complex outermembrane receptor protein